MKKRNNNQGNKKHRPVSVNTFEERVKIQKEINSSKIDINWEVFKKTDEEKALLKQAKKDYNILCA